MFDYVKNCFLPMIFNHASTKQLMGPLDTKLIIPFLIFINLRYSPEFQWFWFPMIGWSIGLVSDWLAANNYSIFLGRNWEEKKIKEMMDNSNDKF